MSIPSGSVEHRWQITPGDEWSGWGSLGGIVLFNDIDVFRNGDCRIEIFGVGTNHKMYTTWQANNSSSGDWKPWTSIDGFLISLPSTAEDPDHNFGVCATGSDNATWCNMHTRPSGSPWTGWRRH